MESQLILKGAQDPFTIYAHGYVPEECSIPIQEAPYIVYDRSVGVVDEATGKLYYPSVKKNRVITWPAAKLTESADAAKPTEWVKIARDIFDALIKMDSVFPFSKRHYRPVRYSQKVFINPLPGEVEVVKELFERAKATHKDSVASTDDAFWYVRNLLADAASCPHGFYHPQEAMYHLILLYEYILEALGCK